MYQRLGEDNGMDVLGLRSITFTHSHLTRTRYEITHDDEQVIHHGSEKQYKSDDTHDPSHLLDVRALRVHFAENGKVVI